MLDSKDIILWFDHSILESSLCVGIILLNFKIKGNIWKKDWLKWIPSRSDMPLFCSCRTADICLGLGRNVWISSIGVKIIQFEGGRWSDGGLNVYSNFSKIFIKGISSARL